MHIIQIDKSNVRMYDHCLIKNHAADGYEAKSRWILDRLDEGLIVKRALIDNETAAFIEYIPIENAWRAVTGKNYLFIHCMFTYPKKFQARGIANKLIEDCIEEANKQKKDGVAVITSNGSFMADSRVFQKCGFSLVADLNKHELLVFKTKPKAIDPQFADVLENAKKYKGLHMFYSDQCPSLAKPVTEILDTCKQQKIALEAHYIQTAKDAQNAPFVSGTFGIVHDSKVYAERVVSKTRFLNIAKQVL